jgi:hypothetical protein
VFEAIQLRLKGKGSDEKFLNTIIWSGGLSVIVRWIERGDRRDEGNHSAIPERISKGTCDVGFSAASLEAAERHEFS